MTSDSKLLQNKTAIVTGASRGIGKAIATLFATHGCNLFLNSRTGKDLDSLCGQLSQQHHVQCISVPFDVSSNDQVKEAFQQIHKSGAVLDIVVNNAGVMKDRMLGMPDPAAV